MITYGVPPLTLDSIEAAKRPAPKYRKTTRKPKTTRVARTRAGETWSESQFWQFLRSGLRQMSRRWPPLVRLIWLEHRRPNESSNLRLKWEHQCSLCSGWFKRAGMQADHIVPCGTLKTWEDLPVFTRRLLCEVGGLRILCEKCHLARRGESDEGTVR